MTSVFDLDDLEFLRVNGLGLRHVELEKGLDEQKNGSSRGDAVSLANYGLNEAFSSYRHSITRENCLVLQKEMEHFIFCSFRDFHCPSHRYRDAAFHLMSRGDDARIPYDFNSYPLGKCGTRAFSAHQIACSVFTHAYQNEDINHATMQAFLELINKIRQLKIQQAHEWLIIAKQGETKEAKKLATLLSKVIEIYSQNIYLDQPLFSRIQKLIKQPQYTIEDIEKLEDILSTVGSEKKGKSTLVYTYEEEDWDELEELTLKKKLLHYIANQNLPKVEVCLLRLPKNAFAAVDRTMRCPLQMASSLPSTAILKAVYEFDPNYYDLLVNDENLSTPIFLAFRADQCENTAFLLSQRPIHLRDFTCCGLHLFGNPPDKFSDRYFKVFNDLLQQEGATIGNEIKGLFNNPFAIWVRKLGYSDIDPVILLNRLLPLADYHSKYLGLLSCSLELYYLCDYSSHFAISDSPYAEAFVKLRAMILESLSLEECKQINELVRTKTYDGNAEEKLYNDLFHTPLSSEQARKFHLCFDVGGNQPEKQNHQVTNPNRLWQTHAEPQAQIVEPFERTVSDDDVVKSGLSIPCILI
ncbi:hypothetical protein [Legionella maceachernii]|uniref:Uncharacterized protein n=1 Tax=Legionella maceachernii TaxID=466 RepID=A0A0W0WGF9_9GAMM|nr:hypothetical protein [Legionella maceachernii]KTD31423.1 hypothetical protein Lmac_0298 [Legionella maceachernii]SKA23099.1 Gas vesicle protein [Legionella maceachernii]SUO98692.1 Uncharacterised protein [Legionella maceachernii]